MLKMSTPSGSHGLASAASSSAVSVRQAKRALRKEMKATLSKLDTAHVAAQSERITDHVVRHEAFIAARSVSVYVSMAHSEVRTEDLCRRVLEQDKKLYVPRFASPARKETMIGLSESQAPAATFDQNMRMLRISDWADYEALVANKWGISEPAEDFKGRRREDALLADTGGDGLDLILVPGVAFDAWGGRLGHGKGYYDRYIAAAGAFSQERRREKPATVALALKEQVLEPPARVPTDEQDELLDAILLEDGPMDYRAD